MKRHICIDRMATACGISLESARVRRWTFKVGPGYTLHTKHRFINCGRCRKTKAFREYVDDAYIPGYDGPVIEYRGANGNREPWFVKID